MTPPTPDRGRTSSADSSTLSSQVTHSVSVSGNSPTMTFAEALDRSRNPQNLDDTLLGSEDFISWNQPSPPVPTLSGLQYTPP